MEKVAKDSEDVTELVAEQWARTKSEKKQRKSVSQAERWDYNAF